MITRLPGVTVVQSTGTISNVDAYRTPKIPSIDTNALTVDASSLYLPRAVSTSVARGTYLNAATATEPVCRARRCRRAETWHRPGLARAADLGRLPLVLRRRHTRSPPLLAPDIDSSVLIGYPAAHTYLHYGGRPTTIYVRATTSRVTAVDNLLAAQANPQQPEEVNVSQPSAALTAQADAQGAFNVLFLGLGAVALLVGAVGVANIMVISVLERRSEIGLRRALGATKGHIRIQFLSEAILLALIGGAAGVLAGAAATAIYANTKHWAVVIPPLAWAGGLGAALLIGAAAGLLPALRAARLSPTEALWTL